MPKLGMSQERRDSIIDAIVKAPVAEYEVIGTQTLRNRAPYYYEGPYLSYNEAARNKAYNDDIDAVLDALAAKGDTEYEFLRERRPRL